jgi:hypothetical protein
MKVAFYLESGNFLECGFQPWGVTITWKKSGSKAAALQGHRELTTSRYSGIIPCVLKTIGNLAQGFRRYTLLEQF